MLFKFKKPEYNDVDGEYVVPVRMSEEMMHSMCSGWYSIGLGWASLKPRPDGSFDMFVKQADISNDLNLVRLDFVKQALMSALDLAHTVIDDEDDVSNKTVIAAHEVRRLVQLVAN